MKKTKIFKGFVDDHEISVWKNGPAGRKTVPAILDIEINDFISDNGVEVIDIKFSTVLMGDDVYGTALLIYEDPTYENWNE